MSSDHYYNTPAINLAVPNPNTERLCSLFDMSKPIRHPVLGNFRNYWVMLNWVRTGEVRAVLDPNYYHSLPVEVKQKRQKYYKSLLTQGVWSMVINNPDLISDFLELDRDTHFTYKKEDGKKFTAGFWIPMVARTVHRELLTVWGELVHDTPNSVEPEDLFNLFVVALNAHPLPCDISELNQHGTMTDNPLERQALIYNDCPGRFVGRPSKRPHKLYGHYEDNKLLLLTGEDKFSGPVLVGILRTGDFTKGFGENKIPTRDGWKDITEGDEVEVTITESAIKVLTEHNLYLGHIFNNN